MRWPQDPVPTSRADWKSSSPRPGPDLLHSMVQTFTEALMGAEADTAAAAHVGRALERPSPAVGGASTSRAAAP